MYWQQLGGIGLEKEMNDSARLVKLRKFFFLKELIQFLTQTRFPRNRGSKLKF